MLRELKRLYDSFKWYLIFILSIEAILIILFTIKSKENIYDIVIIETMTIFILIIPILLSFFTINFKDSIPEFEMSLPGKYSVMVMKRFFLGTTFVISSFIILNLTLFRNEFYFKFFVPGLIIYFFIYVTLLYIQIYRKQIFIFFICIILFLFFMSLVRQILPLNSSDVIIFKFLRAAIIYNSIFYLLPLLTIFLDKFYDIRFKKRVLLISLLSIILTFFFYVFYLSHPSFGYYRAYRVIGDKVYITKHSIDRYYDTRKVYNIKTKKILQKSITQYHKPNYTIYENENGKIEIVYKECKESPFYDCYFLISTSEYYLKINPGEERINRWVFGEYMYEGCNARNYYWNTCDFFYVLTKNTLYKINLKTFKKERIMDGVIYAQSSSCNFFLIKKNGEYFIVNEKIGVRKIHPRSENYFYNRYFISDNHVYTTIGNGNNYDLINEEVERLLTFNYRYLTDSDIAQFGEYVILSLESGEYILKDGKVEVWPHGKIDGCTNIGDYFIIKYHELPARKHTIILKNPEHQIIAEQKFKMQVGYWIIINYIDGDYYMFMIKLIPLRSKYFPFYKQRKYKQIFQIYKLSDSKWELYDEIR
ncbi:hypothetical protein KAU33_15025 [Candidatus Dependentiae bacterium]|nr:hypothetical protein [Candidatus Dependentiae bacterium]